MTSPEIKPKPCPFPHCSHPIPAFRYENTTGWIECIDCEAQGPITQRALSPYEAMQSAMELWNAAPRPETQEEK